MDTTTPLNPADAALAAARASVTPLESIARAWVPFLHNVDTVSVAGL